MKRLAEFDSIRAIAVLMVMGYHLSIPGFSMGMLGVDVFFVLSGYLITSILVKEWKTNEQISLSKFYLRRILRLFPALFFVLIFVIPFEDIRNVLVTLFYVANWGTILYWAPMSDGFLSHVWSLAVEEQFYIFWPALISFIIASRLPKNRLFLVPLLLALASTTLRSFLFGENAWIDRLYRGTDTHADGLFIGCALALYLSFNGRLPRWFVRTVALFSIPYTIAVYTRIIPSYTLYQGGFTIIALTVGLLIYTLPTTHHSIISSVFSNRFLTYIGKISYGLYLWHIPIFMLNHQVLQLSSHSLVFASIFGTFLVAILSYTFIETPFLKLKDRLQGTSPLIRPT